jgi:hypothetical protein
MKNKNNQEALLMHHFALITYPLLQVFQAHLHGAELILSNSDPLGGN